MLKELDYFWVGEEYGGRQSLKMMHEAVSGCRGQVDGVGFKG